MPGPITGALVSVIAVSAVSLLGLLTLSFDERRVQRLALVFVSFAAGALLGDTFIHLVPEIFRADRPPLPASLLILGGMILFFIVEKLIAHRHHIHHHNGDDLRRPELAVMNLLGDAVHNYIDGLLIGASWLVSPSLGISTTLAVLLHEIPQELGDFAILLHSGLRVRQAATLNFASAAIAIFGTATSLVFGSIAHERVIALLLPLTAGGFVYIAAANLIPELQHDRSVRALVTQTMLITAGVAVMAALTVVG